VEKKRERGVCVAQSISAHEDLPLVDFYEADRKRVAPFVPGSQMGDNWPLLLPGRSRIDDATAPNSVKL